MRSRIVWASLIATCLLAGCGDDGGSPGLDQQLRTRIDAAQVTPLDLGAPQAEARVELGRALMFDKVLSGNRDISCATCHHSLLHTADGLAVSIGTGGAGLGPTRVLGTGRQFIPRNAPEVFNRGAPQWRTMFWDARVAGSPGEGFVTPAGDALPAGLESLLAAQAMFPVTSADEMRGASGDRDVFGDENELAVIPADDFPAIWEALLQRLLALPGYVDMFAAAYPAVASADLGFQHAANAIAAFEIDAWSLAESPWDRYVRGDDTALSDDAKRGALLFFGDAGCGECHNGPLLTDQEYHNIGVPQLGPGKGSSAPLDHGAEAVTGDRADRFAFRTPPLRNVRLTGPWMHNGAFASLEAAVRHTLDPESSLRAYDRSQLPTALRDTVLSDPAVVDEILASLDEDVAVARTLSQAQFDLLVAFLDALTDPAAADLGRDIPESVPSGLPVFD